MAKKIEPEKVNLESMNIAEDNKNKLKELFPSVFTETTDDKGNISESIDFEKLKAELGTFSDVFEGRRERYGMDWPGKKDCIKLIQEPSRATLKPCREESVNFDDTENLFIEGDNLEVLKLLQKSYYGKIKMIYIDPPYNTGKEFIYPDKYSETLETYLAYAGLVDDEGRKFSTNTPNEGRFHTKWMNMMYPRLYLARNLLKDNGLIFVSIDDNEILNARNILNEIFGEENFVDCLIWKKRYGGGAKEKYLISVHEYVLIYAKNITNLANIYIPLTEESISKYYTQKDSNYSLRGPYRTHPLEATKSMGERKNLVYPITAPDGSLVYPKRQWLWSKERAFQALDNNELEFIKDREGNWSVHTKQYLKDENGDMREGKPFSIIDDIYTQHGTNQIIDLFGNAQIFSFPKPSMLIEELIKIGTVESDDIVLDFFAGSCATAHAVIDINSNYKLNRRYIMVQLPEPCGADSEPFKAGYRTIADIGKERIRRVFKQIATSKDSKAHKTALLPGMEEDTLKADLGFKVLKLDQSNFRVWDKLKPDAPKDKIEEQLEMHVEHISPKASQEDILYELLLKEGFQPTVKVEKKHVSDKVYYSVAEGAMLICLEDQITRELIDEMAAAEPFRVICLDKGFQGNDQLKTNAVQTFKSRNQGRKEEQQIIFRTV